MVKLGMICFANDGGLGAQTRRLAEMLLPNKIMVVDSSRFSPNKEVHFDWYPGATIVNGFPKNYDVIDFIDGLTHVLVVENPYNFYLVKACHERGIKVIVQTNYEFCENLDSPHLPIPDLFLMPSYWKLEEMKAKFGDDRVIYLPPPTSVEEFLQPRIKNFKRQHGTRFLHIVGTLAFHDRNGTLDLLRAVQLSKSKFKLVIRSQHPLPQNYLLNDPRIEYRIANVKNNADLYQNFDALILPRRYGGLSLTTNEALMSGLPVMMSDISPNNQLLPPEWLIPVVNKKTFKARAEIDCYLNNVAVLALTLDEWTSTHPSKEKAFHIGVDNFSVGVLKSRYQSLFE